MDSFLFLSACFQSLFNLLEFQRLVLHYSPPVRVQDLPRNQKVNHLSSSTHPDNSYQLSAVKLRSNPPDQYATEIVTLKNSPSVRNILGTYVKPDRR